MRSARRRTRWPTSRRAAGRSTPWRRWRRSAAVSVFGGVGGLDRSALARLYGGRRANVARGWIDEAGRFESVTLVSPYPNASLTALEPGTLIVRFVLDGAHPLTRDGARIPGARRADYNFREHDTMR